MAEKFNLQHLSVDNKAYSFEIKHMWVGKPSAIFGEITASKIIRSELITNSMSPIPNNPNVQHLLDLKASRRGRGRGRGRGTASSWQRQRQRKRRRKR